MAREGQELIYLDNAATSWPKPEEVYTTMDEFLRRWGANPGRAEHEMADVAAKTIEQTRQDLARFFNAPDPKRVVFTFNCSDSLNTAIKGVVKPGDHVITSHLEHNSVIRPLRELAARGVITLSIVAGGPNGIVDPDELRRHITPKTALIAISHGCNAFGTIQPVREIGAVAREYGVLFLVDAAQTAGGFPIDFQADNLDILAFPGHKSLFGPPGTGGLVFGPNVEIEPLKEGGTGINSEDPLQPREYPLRLETGTPNTVGIAGLGAGLRFIVREGVKRIREHEVRMVERLVEGLLGIRGVTVYGTLDARERTSQVSFNLEGWPSMDLASTLERRHKVGGRAGLHCAPLAHEYFGTLKTGGAMRLAPGYFTTEEEIDRAIAAVAEVAREAVK